MKMMRRTSTTSTRGVTLMSDFTLPLPPTCMELCLSGFLGLGDQADVVETDLATSLEDVDDVAVLDLAIAFDGDLAVRRALMDLFERRLHLVFADHVRADVDGAVVLDRNLQLLLRIRRLLRIRGDR